MQTVKNVFDFGVEAAITLAVLYTVYGGFVILTSGGDKSRYTTGRKAIINAIIGVVIALGAWIIVDTILRAIGGGGVNLQPWTKLPC